MASKQKECSIFLLGPDDLKEKITPNLNSQSLFEKTSTESSPMLTTSEIIEHLFCPRFTYFIHCLKIPQHEELRHKVLLGRTLHEKKEKQNIDYLRKKIGCTGKEISVYLTSREFRIKGIVDEVLYLNDGSLAPLDYKYVEYNDFIFKTHKIQSTIYAMLISENYKREVHKGFICYTKCGNKLVQIDYSEKDFGPIKKIISEIFYIIQAGFFPKKSPWPSRCIDCCYRNICVAI